MNGETPEAQALIHEQTAVFLRLCEVAADATWTLIENAPTPALRIRAYEITDSISKLAIDAMGKET